MQIFVDVASAQEAKFGEIAYGDSFMSTRNDLSGDVTAVLSDGLGSGIKANVLSILTSKIALEMFSGDGELEDCAKLIYKTLPRCSIRKISYATFTVVKVQNNNQVSIIEYDNPEALIYRSTNRLPLDTKTFIINRKNAPTAHIRKRQYQARIGDRIIFFSDGVTQAGLGTSNMPIGWQNISPFIEKELKQDPFISARKLSSRIVNEAKSLDIGKAKDDISCSVVHIRTPRKVILVSGPPFNEKHDSLLAAKLKEFEGKKIACGGTTAQIIAREWKTKVKVNLSIPSGKLPPGGEIKGLNLVTEGILTLARLVELLEKNEAPRANQRGNKQNDPARQLMEILLDSDCIHIIAGTRINEAHQDPAMPVELEIRRNILKKLAGLLSTKHLKDTHIEYL